MRRLIDLTGASILSVLLSPVLAGLALAIRLSMGRPILFRQQRPGYKGEPFEVYKFRTMKDAVDAEGELLPDEERLTKVGVFMRQLSLDELPQLWNILKGDMSFIGPRPLLMEFLRWYTPEQMRRHEVKPGVTGWAAGSGTPRHPLFQATRARRLVRRQPQPAPRHEDRRPHVPEGAVDAGRHNRRKPTRRWTT